VANCPTTPADFAEIYRRFSSAVSRHDCGRFCAPLNDGAPVCCTTDHAIPVVEKSEFALLKSRTDLWRRFRPKDAAGRQIVDELSSTCMAVECKGARHCERDNRTLACRAFPFYPYLTKDDELIGLATYWIFEDRCWLISNMQVVERQFVGEFISAYEYLFARDPEEYQAYKEHSAQHRRVFSRQGRFIPLIGRAGGYLKVLPHGKGVVPAKSAEFPQLGAYRSPRVYQRAVKEAGGTMPATSPFLR